MSVRSPSTQLAPDGALDSCVAALRGAAFWTSVALGLAYPPLLVALAANAVGTTALLATVAANVAVLIVGHGYRPPGRDTDGGSPEARA